MLGGEREKEPGKGGQLGKEKKDEREKKRREGLALCKGGEGRES